MTNVFVVFGKCMIAGRQLPAKHGAPPFGSQSVLYPVGADAAL